jgi:predicted AlkP superfamily phosphohydrolase/phosphomutase
MPADGVIIIGLDGATFDMIDPLIAKGYLPNLKYFIENGASGILFSTIPPVTGPAWMALATGKNPGKTGVFDFRNLRNIAKFRLEPITSADFYENASIWDYVSASGGKVGVYNYPMLFPPYSINGIMVSGLGSPEDAKLTYPANLQDEILRIIDGKNKIIVPYNKINWRNHKLFIDELNRLLDNNIKVIDYLLNRDNYDFFIGVISATDFLNHRLWRYWEEFKKGNIDCNIYYARDIVNIWTKIDEFLGSLARNNPSKNIFLVSDHGFGELKYSFGINKWLEEEGYLIKKPQNISNNLLQSIHGIATSVIPRIPAMFNNYLRSIKNRVIPDFINQIDLLTSRAFALDHSEVGQIYLNHGLRNPEAPIKTIPEFERIREEISLKLKSFVEGDDHLGTVEIFYPEEIYHGDKLNFLPDIIFTIDNMACDVPPAKFDVNLQLNSNQNKTGTHRKEGIFIAFGQSICKNTQLTNTNLVDIAPTILHLLGLGVPVDMDGIILRDALAEQNPEIKAPSISMSHSPGVSIDNDEAVKHQLRELGYLE